MQTEADSSKGYPEHDIVMAVIESICPDRSIRGYLEALKGVRLSKLKQIMRARFKEQSYTELYQSLVNLAQLPDEDLQSFRTKALNMREYMLINAEDKITYNPTLVKGIS